LTGADNEVEIISTLALPATISLDNDGETTLPARKLFDIVRSLSDKDSVQLSVTDHKAVLKSGKSRFTLACLPAEDFPQSPLIETHWQLKLTQREFRRLLAQTGYAIAVNDPRHFLNGLCLDVQTERLVVVATDGHRLALANTPLADPVSEPLQVILPRKAVLELQRILDETESEITLTLSESACKVVVSEQYTLSSKLIDGRFPDYTSVIPHDPPYVVGVETSALKAALTQVAILSHEKHRGARLSFSAGQVTVSSRNPEQEEAAVECAVDYAGEAFEIGFNINYLLEALAAVHTDTVYLKFNNPESSVLITPFDTEETKMVVMPMRI
jgi:DNA polymerase-3 subunit beta